MKTYTVKPVTVQKWVVEEFVQEDKLGSVSHVGEFDDHDRADEYCRYLREKNR